MKFEVKEGQRKEDQFQEKSVVFENIIRFILSSPITDSCHIQMKTNQAEIFKIILFLTLCLARNLKINF